eukprot:m.1168872 g.1168872  ORF g.1168872 m.1168872 type:complete len:502 (+) comp24508_c0_seq80:190-1695(+)
MLNLLQFLCLASALLQYPHSLGSTVGSTRTSATSTTTTSVPAIFQNETLHSLAPGTVRINVFRATSASTALSLANTNAADAEGEIGFLGNDCIRRRKGEDVVSPCDGTGVISHFVVVVDVPFSCYIMMNDGQCDGCLSSDAPCSVCTSSSPNCLAVAESTGGHVGMTRPVDGGAGWWYSFQAMSECNDNETIGDNGCTWKIESVPKSVRVCCVNIFNQSTFLDSFDACDAVDVSDSTIDADGSWSCDTTTTETGFLGSSTTTLSSATSSQSIRTTGTCCCPQGEPNTNTLSHLSVCSTTDFQVYPSTVLGCDLVYVLPSYCISSECRVSNHHHCRGSRWRSGIDVERSATRAGNVHHYSRADCVDELHFQRPGIILDRGDGLCRRRCRHCHRCCCRVRSGPDYRRVRAAALVSVRSRSLVVIACFKEPAHFCGCFHARSCAQPEPKKDGAAVCTTAKCHPAHALHCGAGAVTPEISTIASRKVSRRRLRTSKRHEPMPWAP